MNASITMALAALKKADLGLFADALAKDAEEREAARTLSSFCGDADSLMAVSVKDDAWVARAKRSLASAEKQLKGAEADKKKKELKKAIADAELRNAAAKKKTADAACRDFKSKYTALRNADLTGDNYLSLLEDASDAAALIDVGDPLYAVVSSAFREFSDRFGGKNREEILLARECALGIRRLLKMSAPDPKDVFALWERTEKAGSGVTDRIPDYRKFSDLRTKLKKEKDAHDRQIRETVADYQKRLDALQKQKPSPAWLDAVLQINRQLSAEHSEVTSGLKISWLSTACAAADDYRRAFDYDAKLAAVYAKTLSYSDVHNIEKLLDEVDRLPYAVSSKMQNTGYTAPLQSAVKKLIAAEKERQRQEEKRRLDAAIDECYARATRGDVGSMTQLALYYFEGNGVTQDYDEAFRWFEKAAKKGDAKAMEKLGDCYMNGYGVRADYRMAEKCYKKAEKLGR